MAAAKPAHVIAGLPPRWAQKVDDQSDTKLAGPSVFAFILSKRARPAQCPHHLIILPTALITELTAAFTTLNILPTALNLGRLLSLDPCNRNI
jgi:hypothetical protein